MEYRYTDFNKLINDMNSHINKYGAIITGDDRPKELLIGFKSNITEDSWVIGINSFRSSKKNNKEKYYICY